MTVINLRTKKLSLSSSLVIAARILEVVDREIHPATGNTIRTSLFSKGEEQGFLCFGFNSELRQIFRAAFAKQFEEERLVIYYSFSAEPRVGGFFRELTKLAKGQESAAKAEYFEIDEIEAAGMFVVRFLEHFDSLLI